ncbi:hypothetical protein LJC07_06480 [Christensenellaceae bacterium OttesenSCG-928-L17]|nr:hypothetical protein [Christensenellaceae bacterium OttesenSCG-928-L17]
MDFSSANVGLWGVIIQMGIIAALILFANLLRRKLPFIRKSLMPTAVIAGFLLLILRWTGVVPIDTEMLEMITYHGIALGFIAMSLRVPNKSERTDKGSLVAPKSGALIVCCYLIQGILGMIISLALAYTFMPELFKASGILLPMGYGQGPGQANNIGGNYETLGFVGGRSFALSIAAAGYLSACIVGVIYLNVLKRKGKIHIASGDEMSGSVTVDTFQDKDEIPISESIDKLSMQAALIVIAYLLTYLATWGLSSLAGGLGENLGNTVSTLLWGFNFIIGSVVAMLIRSLLKGLRKAKMMTRQYQNNYLLSRLSGLAFDLMIVAGIGSINIEDLSGLWTPFLLMSVSGAVVTLVFLMWLCKYIYKDYYQEGMLSMYGMMTGTISSGVLLLRELDPLFETPAANNLITGSSTAVLFGAPMLLLIGLAPSMPLVVVGLMAAYLLLLLWFIIKMKPRKKR